MESGGNRLSVCQSPAWQQHSEGLVEHILSKPIRMQNFRAHHASKMNIHMAPVCLKECEAGVTSGIPAAVA
jgi:hypothetical protein